MEDMDRKMPICELSYVIQGEGKYAGHPSVLVRTTGCPLRCCFSGSKCDSPFASWDPEKGSFSIKDVIDFTDKIPKVKHMIITGGEPLLHQQLVRDLVDVARVFGMMVTIETSGSIDFSPSVFDHSVDMSGVFLSISPKLSTSIPTVEDGASASDILRHTAMISDLRILTNVRYFADASCHGFQMKFVTDGSHADMEEIDRICEAVSLASDATVYLMPAGANNGDLDKVRKRVVGRCLDGGFIYTDRLHIVVFGDVRGV